MTECSALEELVHEAPDSAGIKSSTIAMGIHILLQVPLAVLEDENEFGLCVDNIVEADDVYVLQFFHKRDFADGGRWSAFFRIEVNLFESDDFICRARATLRDTSELTEGKRNEPNTPCTL